MDVVEIILSSLVENEDYTRTVAPFLKEEYFDEGAVRDSFSLFQKYFEKYNVLPSMEALVIDASSLGRTQEVYDETVGVLGEMYSNDIHENMEYLIESTEKFCKDRSLYNALLEAVSIVDGDDKQNSILKMSKDGIPDLMRDALSISFDTRVGHNVLEDAEERYEYYHAVDSRIPFDIDFLNQVTTRGDSSGLPKKTLSSIIGQPGAGKTLALIHFANWYMQQGKNVLYISMEMSEFELSARVDTNMLDMKQEELMSLDRKTYLSRVKKINDKLTGKLIIKEYPTGSAHVGHFRHAVNELKTKKNFTPDVIIVDYMNICASSRVKGDANSYTIVKSVAEELRGFAIEQDVPVLTANQPGRGAFNSGDMDMDSVADSIGVAYTLDLFIAMITDDVLRANSQVIMKVIKNRLGPVGGKSVVGIDYEKMRLFNTESSASADLQTFTPKAKNPAKTFKDFDFGDNK